MATAEGETTPPGEMEEDEKEIIPQVASGWFKGTVRTKMKKKKIFSLLIHLDCFGVS